MNAMQGTLTRSRRRPRTVQTCLRVLYHDYHDLVPGNSYGVVEGSLVVCLCQLQLTNSTTIMITKHGAGASLGRSVQAWLTPHTCCLRSARHLICSDSYVQLSPLLTVQYLLNRPSLFSFVGERFSHSHAPESHTLASASLIQ